MNTESFSPSLTKLNEACDKLGLDISNVIDHFSENLKNVLEATNFPFLKEGEILYKEGDKIIGNEKVIRTVVEGGATCNLISENYFKVSTEGLILLQDNTEAVNAFSPIGYREESVIKEWPKAKKLPEWIYFCKKTSSTSFGKLEKHYTEVAPRIELNVLAAFNAKYPNFHKNFPNGIQRKDSKGICCCAVFDQWRGRSGVGVVRDGRDWFVEWWFACASN